MLRYLTAGESHGPALTAILEGMVSNLQIGSAEINADLARRQGGYGRGGRMLIEKDEVEILAGIRHGKTLGSPIALVVHNKDWVNWQDVMAVEGFGTGKKVTRLRPGHADLPGVLKYDQDDLRNILERASARETTMRVAVGAVCKKFLGEFGVRIFSHVVQIGSVKAPSAVELARAGRSNGKAYRALAESAEESVVRCGNSRVAKAMVTLIDEASEKKDSLGGVFEVVALNLPVGLGSHVHYDRKLDGRLAQALMSIQAMKGVEIGIGFEAAGRFGSKVHDEIFLKSKKIVRGGNNAGGLEGGMTNGEPLIVRVAQKPISTLRKPLRSIDIATGKPSQAHFERADICAVPAGGVIGEAVVAFELARAFLEKFGGDSLGETRRNYQGNRGQIS